MIENWITADLAPLFRQYQQKTEVSSAAKEKGKSIKVEKKWDKLLQGIAEHLDEITVVAGAAATGVLLWAGTYLIKAAVDGLRSGIRPYTEEIPLLSSSLSMINSLSLSEKSLDSLMRISSPRLFFESACLIASSAVISPDLYKSNNA